MHWPEEEYGWATELFRRMADDVERINRDKGWYDDHRTFGDDVALLHSEVSEMLEAYRNYGTEDVTVHRNPEESMCPMDFTCTQHKPEGIGSEAADVLVRLLDTCKRYDVDLFAEWYRKVSYNETRPARHGGKRL